MYWVFRRGLPMSADPGLAWIDRSDDDVGAAATGTYVVQEVIDAGASVAGETYETMTVTAERSSKWNAGEALTGFFRILNSSGQDATIYCQKKI